MIINEVRQLQKIAGLINEDLDQKNPNNQTSTSEEVNTIPELQKYLRTKAIEIPKIKGIDVKEVEELVNMINTILNVIGKASIGTTIKNTTNALNTKLDHLK